MTATPHPPDENDCAAVLAGTSGVDDTGQQRDGNSSTESPEHRGDRRRFLVWALMLGATSPEVVAERIVAELASAP